MSIGSSNILCTSPALKKVDKIYFKLNARYASSSTPSASTAFVMFMVCELDFLVICIAHKLKYVAYMDECPRMPQLKGAYKYLPYLR